MLPNGPVNPTQGSYHPAVTLNGSMEPTPPPEVIAMTKFIYDEPSNGSAERIKMWVANVRHVGGITMCDGWMLRYPPSTGTGAQRQIGTATNPLSGGVQVSIGAKHVGVLPPIVEVNASAVCSERKLVPFAPSPAPSP
jgi:hypothetical protein